MLLTTTPPPGTTRVTAPAARRELIAPRNQNPPTGSVLFRNGGATAVQAIAAADVPWLIPQSGPTHIVFSNGAMVSAVASARRGDAPRRKSSRFAPAR